jgi:hypothetical protein
LCSPNFGKQAGRSINISIHPFGRWHVLDV